MIVGFLCTLAFVSCLCFRSPSLGPHARSYKNKYNCLFGLAFRTFVPDLCIPPPTFFPHRVFFLSSQAFLPEQLNSGHMPCSTIQALLLYSTPLFQILSLSSCSSGCHTVHQSNDILH